MEQASQFELVDNLMPLWVAQRHCLAAMVTSICVYQRYFIKGDSNRANGTKLAAKGNAIQEINNDRAYYGQVDILSNPYLTGYEPMRDNAAKVIGMWLTRQI
jgi:methyl-accepting chemotaxis protein